MAWRSSGRTNIELITNMAHHTVIHSDRVAAAMKKVDRAHYVLRKADAYEDSPQAIGHGATISAPHMHAYAAEHLLPFLKPGAKVLDVGSGSGYLCAVFHHLISSEDQPGKVVGIEHIPQLAEWSVQNLKSDGLGPVLEKNHIEVVVGDGRLGYPRGGPYDAIHVGAAAPTMPSALVEQLAQPGMMFIPVGTHTQYIWKVSKDTDGNVSQERVMGVVYVPLTDRPTF